MTRVLVLNASFEPLNVCTVKRAVVLLIKAKAEIVEEGEAELRAEAFSLSTPVVIRLITYVRLPRPTFRRVTRRAVLARDDFSCVYCESTEGLTIDHVIPRARGGETSWENVVASCSPCNQRKGDSLLHEVGMRLRRQPKAPPPTVFVFVAVRKPPASWEQWLIR